MARVILDISRLVTRSGHAAPTGIDRVELAYALHFLARPAAERGFAVTPPGLPTRLVGDGPAGRLIQSLAQRWHQALGVGSSWALVAGMARSAFGPSRRPAAVTRGSVYLNISHHHLEDEATIRRFLRRERARYVAFIHDLIPLDFPEYARPGIAQRHGRRIAVTADLADAILVNSRATAASLASYLTDHDLRHPPIVVAPLGVAPQSAPPPGAIDRPYFVVLGTIEPRKNHLLLLHIWRRLVEQRAAIIPRLIVVGRRGWENEMVLDLLERCPALAGHVEELSGLSDREVHACLAGARALLIPSFAEGYGLPLAEALALGIPVIASDQPALVEVGGPVPDYIDPLDGLGWLAAIEDYARSPSVRRQAQIARLPGWAAPSWPGHMAIVQSVVDRVASNAGQLTETVRPLSYSGMEPLSSDRDPPLQPIEPEPELLLEGYLGDGRSQAH